MGKNSKIEWTHHTFNPWWGCVKVSHACKYCYAETWARRVGLNVWGGRSDRRFFSDRHWKEPLKWDKEAAKDGVRRRVFCASMADVFEVRAELNPWRERLWELIDSTPNLDWLLLTKRPQNFSRYLPGGRAQENVWLGTTVENQKWADKRIRDLVSCEGTIRFLSCEPLLGPIDLSAWLPSGDLDWVIAGGESGGKARPTDPRWITSLRDQCISSRVAFHFKQWGHWTPHGPGDGRKASTITMDDDESIRLWRLSKKDAGRMLEGRTWDEVPVRAI